jgi:hypothetical protein
MLAADEVFLETLRVSAETTSCLEVEDVVCLISATQGPMQNNVLGM